ncbi:MULTISPECIES: GTP-dependent dephospho-CoA kinase family protein [Halobellus]|uniref:GTP-dependent dephospho-CoA kinase family protein n=1 Tax=Halobellus TaxID=1073986 RepID=UPI00210C75BF|nr:MULTISPECIES: GTP-dependent dephospho-CoA kinase family protein [Halobellus]MDQ2055210.1 GTP-dependent dephospho-CoA kinase family protein [Halobellus sp. H-GB7]
MLTLPAELRGAFKEPFGPVYEDAEALLADAGRPVIAVGDVVTYHLRQAGHIPAVALVDGRTEREAVDEEISDALSDPEHRRAVENAPGVISEDLLVALVDALDADAPITIVVDGEEDLAALPAVLAAPTGATVVYGQPGEGMVRVEVTADAKAEMRSLFERMEGDVDAALATLGVED